MLFHSNHRFFADQPSLLRERIFAWFAGNEPPKALSPKAESAEPPSSPKKPGAGAGGESIASTQANVSRSVAELTPEMDQLIETEWYHALSVDWSGEEMKVFREVAGRHAIVIPEDTDPLDVLARLHRDGQLPDGLLQEALRSLLRTPHSVIAFTRKLERYGTLYDQLRDVVEDETDVSVVDLQGKKRYLANTHLLTADLELLQARLAAQEKSLSEWFRDTSIEEIRRTLHEDDEEPKPNLMRRAFDVLSTFWRENTWGSRVAPRQTAQEYRGTLKQHITALRHHLFLQLSAQAGTLRSARANEYNEVMATFTEKHPEFVDASSGAINLPTEADVDAFDAAFKQEHGVSFDAFERATHEALTLCDQALPDMQRQWEEQAEAERRAREGTGEPMGGAELTWRMLKEQRLDLHHREFLERTDTFLARMESTQQESALESARRERTQAQEDTQFDARVRPAFQEAAAVGAAGSDDIRSANELYAKEDHLGPQDLPSDAMVETARLTPLLAGGTVAEQPPIDEAQATETALHAQQTFERLEASLQPIRDYRVCALTGLAQKVLTLRQETATRLAGAQDVLRLNRGGSRTDALQTIAWASSIAQSLELVESFLKNPPAAQEYDDPKDTRHGYFNAQEGIRINTAQCKNPAQKQEALTHERGHALQHLLTHEMELKTAKGTRVSPPLFPLPFIETYNRFAAANPSFAEDLKQAGKRWGISGESAQDRNDLMEEAFMMYVTAKDRGTYSGFTEAERRVFSAFDRQLTQVEATVAVQKETRRRLERTFALPGDEAEGESEGDAGEESDRTINISYELDCIDEKLTNIEALKDVPEFRGLYAELNAIVQQRGLRTEYESLKGTTSDDESTLERVKQLKGAVNELANSVKNFIREQRETPVHAPEEETFWYWFTTEITWVSLLDIWSMVKDGKEDFMRMWKRRSERARNKLGSKIMKIIPTGVPYLGRLKHEYYRREQTSELEEVSQWEKALENVDSLELLESFKKIYSDSDRIKATLNLLTKRGRMVWSDEGFLECLNRHSRFKMPVKACMSNGDIRYEWFQKIMSDIWDDKEEWVRWSAANNTGIKNGREDFHTRANWLSSTGEMSHELEYQLKTWCEWKKGDRKGALPDRVHPHAYEKYLHYAMTYGKMRMEDKFYFLIRGISEGLLSHDRLTNLIAELGATVFPFIDYFEKQHNTIRELKVIADRITEGENSYFPGVKATVWLMTVISSDEKARQRASKLLSRAGDAIDHEDIPTLMTMITAGYLDEFMAPQTGQKQRLTPEGRKNGYCGFGSLFKTYAIIANLRKSQEPPKQALTQYEAQMLAKKLLCYVHYDNVLTSAANTGGKNRPTLSWNSIENETMPSNENFTPKHYRDPLNQLAFNVISRYMNVGGQNRLPCLDEAKRRQYLGQERGHDRYTEKAQLETVWGITEKLEEELAAAIVTDPTLFSNALIELKDNLKGESDDLTERNIVDAVGDHI